MKRINEQMERLVKGGATISGRVVPDWVQPIAAAEVIAPGELWFCGLFPEDEFAQHWLSFTTPVILDGAVQLWKGNELVAAVAAMEDDEPTLYQWDRWNRDEMKEARDYVRALHTQAKGGL